MPKEITNVTVLGSGVVGLSTAIRLQENGYNVRIIAEKHSPETTSDVAAAFWYPYHVGGTAAKVIQQASATLKVFYDLRSDDSCGITLARGKEFFKSSQLYAKWREDTWWRKNEHIGCREIRSDIPDGFEIGVEFTLPVIHMPTYMHYLRRRFDGSGTKSIFSARVSSTRVHPNGTRLKFIPDLFENADLVVNCSGLGSYELMGDDKLWALEGQVVSIEANNPNQELIFITTGLPYSLDRPLYIVPRGKHDVILGGTAFKREVPKGTIQPPAPDPHVTKDIIDRCKAMFPGLVVNVRKNGSKIGYRPSREPVGVRLEVDNSFGTDKPVIHNYGHGGAGVTLSWGCADEVVHLARSLRNP